jgi:uncharacterized protein (TIGR00369 family)
VQILCRSCKETVPPSDTMLGVAWLLVADGMTRRPASGSRSLSPVDSAPADPPLDPTDPVTESSVTSAEGVQVAAEPRSLDGVTTFMGMRWDDPETVRLTIRPELINNGGLLSGVVTYALVDYCMGSTLWAQTTEQERIATINIAINYLQTATAGEIVCRTTLDRRNRTIAVLRSEVRHEDGRLMVTAIGSYSIFPPRSFSEPRRT